MAKLVKWSKQAVADRIQILDYWFRRLGDKTYSRKLDKHLREAILLLSEHPLMGKQSEKLDLRCFVKGNYRIYYQIKKDCIELLHLWDSRRNPEDRRKT
ncbi:MAG: type II toxin-antitoxin system RelE/ParE family toxin [bacterium]|nr:type II toxin-antitoxin system RelE/ParE family toxin [bacterium]